MLQTLVVALIVAFAVLQAARKFLPLAWRRQLVYALSRRGLSQAALAKWFKTTSDCGDGCSTCGSCDTDEGAAAAPKSAAGAPAPSSGAPRHRVIRLHKLNEQR
jgi:hypothetical protein